MCPAICQSRRLRHRGKVISISENNDILVTHTDLHATGLALQHALNIIA